MQALIEYAAYMPHGYCLFWQPWLVVLYAGSDFLIFTAYALIPIALVIFLRRRPEIRHRGLIALFAAFILLCGITHLVSIVTLWVPVYPLHGVAKLVTGAVSLLTAVVLFTLIPRLVAIPSPHQLELVNARLRAAVKTNEAMLAELEEARRDLEARVDQRTAELTEANRRLAVASREAVHRSRNLLTVVSALAQQTARNVPDLESFLGGFAGRLEALATATATVAEGPAAAAVPLGDVIRRQLAPVLGAFGERIAVGGPAVDVGPEAAQQVALALHELGTNAIKFGALASAEGRVDLGWSLTGGAEGRLILVWREDAAEPVPGDPRGRTGGGSGFGTRLLTEVVPGTLRGRATVERGDDGFAYTLTVPLAALAPALAPAGPAASRETRPDPASARAAVRPAPGAPPGLPGPALG